MKVAICGGGSVGTTIARDLHKSGHEVLVLERDPDIVERRRREIDVTWIAADACEVASLDAAGLATVDVVVAATGDDEDNLVISLLAKQEFAVPRVVARVNHSKNQWLFNEGWGVDISVSTPQLITAIVEEAVSVGSLVRLLEFEGEQPTSSRSRLPRSRRRSPTRSPPSGSHGRPRSSPSSATIGSSCPAPRPCSRAGTKCSWSSPRTPSPRSATCSSAHSFRLPPDQTTVFARFVTLLTHPPCAEPPEQRP